MVFILEKHKQQFPSHFCLLMLECFKDCVAGYIVGCPHGQYSCDGYCHDVLSWCDGVLDCTDGFDELPGCSIGECALSLLRHISFMLNKRLNDDILKSNAYHAHKPKVYSLLPFYGKKMRSIMHIDYFVGSVYQSSVAEKLRQRTKLGVNTTTEQLGGHGLESHSRHE